MLAVSWRPEFVSFLRKSDFVNLETEDGGTAINTNCHNIISSTAMSITILFSVTVMQSEINLMLYVVLGI